jgi:Methane oxygenase PmoA
MAFAHRAIGFATVVTALAYVASTAEADELPVEFARGNGRITVAVDGLPVAVYCYKDDKISRPYFAHVRAPSGVQVTRHHPPIEGQDIMDHDTFHPGIWMSFGDISGSDYWRLKARVRHAKFADEPHGGRGKGTFAAHNEYLDQKNPSKVVCNEAARFTFLPRPAGYLLLWDSTFSADKEFYFGDQEEMGLGFRVATPLRVGTKPEDKVPPGNGSILDSEGRKNEKQIWGNSANWCNYSGTMAGQRLGMTIFCHPDNLRPSWFHARDYGFLEANQFGRKSFGKGETSKVVVRPGEKLRLRYGVLIHSGPTGSQLDLAAAYQDYVRLTGNK